MSIKATKSGFVCLAFMDLHKACPKDSFTLPKIDKLVDSTAESELYSFCVAFSGYKQIRMHPDDQEKNAFIKNLSLYYYKVVPFELKNAEATYKRL